jgi:hypothetical protein
MVARTSCSRPERDERRRSANDMVRDAGFKNPWILFIQSNRAVGYEIGSHIIDNMIEAWRGIEEIA